MALVCAPDMPFGLRDQEKVGGGAGGRGGRSCFAFMTVIAMSSSLTDALRAIEAELGAATFPWSSQAVLFSSTRRMPAGVLASLLHAVPAPIPASLILRISAQRRFTWGDLGWALGRWRRLSHANRQLVGAIYPTLRSMVLMTKSIPPSCTRKQEEEESWRLEPVLMKKEAAKNKTKRWWCRSETKKTVSLWRVTGPLQSLVPCMRRFVECTCELGHKYWQDYKMQGVCGTCEDELAAVGAEIRLYAPDATVTKVTIRWNAASGSNVRVWDLVCGEGHLTKGLTRQAMASLLLSSSSSSSSRSWCASCVWQQAEEQKARERYRRQRHQEWERRQHFWEHAWRWQHQSSWGRASGGGGGGGAAAADDDDDAKQKRTRQDRRAYKSPSFFRDPIPVAWTTDERQAAVKMPLASRSAPLDCLCLPATDNTSHNRTQYPGTTVRAHYRRMALLVHPDKTGSAVAGAADAFKVLSSAYDLIQRVYMS